MRIARPQGLRTGPMDWTHFCEIVQELPYGKRLPTAVYFHREAITARPSSAKVLLDDLSLRHSIGPEFNVVKLRTDVARLSFLSYPMFEDEPHPSLLSALAIDLATGKCCISSYKDNLNPPILHRKELLLAPDHPRILEYATLTMAEEDAGLFEDTAIIGFRLNWERLLAARGLCIEAHALRTIEGVTTRPEPMELAICRHRTALSRNGLSNPVRSLLEHNQLQPGFTVFDYGCGRGADVRGLQKLGYEVNGWDPVHLPNGEKLTADVINLGYVLNVIEDPVERIETLINAWGLTRRLLVVSTLIGEPPSSSVLSYQDGIVTKRQTFQKYFNQQELQGYIEDALEMPAIPVALGIFYVFRKSADHELFLQSRYRRTLDWASVATEGVPRKRSEAKLGRRTIAPGLYEQHRELLEDFWAVVMSLGRLPMASEYQRYSDIQEVFGSPQKALRVMQGHGRAPLLEASRAARRNDILVYLASANLRRRLPFSQLSASVQVDLRTFFGSYRRALDEGLQLLRSAADPATVALACDNSVVGWQDERSLYVSTMLVDRLPIVLRAYVASAELLFGVAAQADIVRIHKFSGRATFLSYRNFASAMVPELAIRTRVDLRTCRVDPFDHRAEGQLLYFKERFLSADAAERVELSQIGGTFRELGISDGTFWGPSKAVLTRLLVEAGRFDLIGRVFRDGSREGSE